jgi:hypothetical protein
MPINYSVAKLFKIDFRLTECAQDIEGERRQTRNGERRSLQKQRDRGGRISMNISRRRAVASLAAITLLAMPAASS